ncbi:uncharacterized protein LOC123518031 [Portunus trituberculatus]|uniref:uncharacterized protein LOC123518031 n=1 Tax=Portunus trituberculatus TaxID=210409 RepID=UPI001E1D0A12|nr:uncharacterized protein LOC123518031 [Portunus trituberculatus]
MRFILGCPSSTRIVNMLTELKLPFLADRIHSNVTSLTTTCLHTPHLALHYTHVVRTAMGPNARLPRIHHGGRNLIKHVCSLLHSLHISIDEAEVVPVSPPWRVPLPAVLFTEISKEEIPVLQQQRAMETIAAVTSSIPTPHRIFTDGSLQPDGRAGSVAFSPDLDPPVGGWTGRRLPDSSSSTYSWRRQLVGKSRASIGRHLPCLRSAAMLAVKQAMNAQRVISESIQHYDTMRAHSFKYRRTGLMVRRHNVVSARIRLGYRPVLQVARLEEEQHFTTCQLCNAPFSNTL